MKTQFLPSPLGVARFACLLLFSWTGLLVAQTGPVAHYPLNGNALDASGNGNHGTPVGAVLTTDRFGQPNSAYEFDGVDDYIEFVSNFNFQPQLPLTIAAWVLIEDYDPNCVFRNNYQQNTYDGAWLNANGQIYATYGDGGAVGPSSRRTKMGTTTLNLNVWYHTAIIIRGPQDMDIFVNGVNDCGTYSGSGGALSYIVATGRAGESDGLSGAGGLRFFHGKMDEIRMYDRELSVEEIQILAGYTGMLDTTICQGDSIQLDGGEANTYSWSPVADLSCTNCPTPLATPQTTTSYILTRTNTAGCTSTDTVTLTVDSCIAAPVITCADLNLSAAMNTQTDGFTVTAIDTSLGQVDSLVWDLGNGTTISGEAGDTLDYTYPVSGNYELCLYVYGFATDTLCVNSICIPLNLISCTDLNLAAAMNTQNSGLTITAFDLSTGQVDSLVWDLGNGTTISGEAGDTLNYTYPASGAYDLCLYVYGFASDSLCVDSVCTSFDLRTCEDLNLTAVMNSQTNGAMLTATDVSLGQVDSLVWDVGNGTTFSGQAGDMLNYTYPVQGVYDLCLYIYGFIPDSTCVDSVCLTVFAQDTFECSTLNLSASFSYSTQLLDISCTGQSSGGTIDYINWDFGDGTILTLPTGVNPTHTYSSPGSYQVCMEAVDSVNAISTCSATDCQVVMITDQPCDTLDVVAYFGYDPQGLTLFLSDSSTGNGLNLLEWDLGDGTPLLTTLPGATPPHTYALPGMYQVCLTAIDQVDESLTCDSTYCTLITVEQNVSVYSPLNQIRLYPNPGGEELKIDIPLAFPIQVEIVNMQGRRVIKTQFKPGIQSLDTFQWATGIYAIRLSAQNHQAVMLWEKRP